MRRHYFMNVRMFRDEKITQKLLLIYFYSLLIYIMLLHDIRYCRNNYNATKCSLFYS